MAALIKGVANLNLVRLLLEKLNARSERRLLPSLRETIDTLKDLFLFLFQHANVSILRTSRFVAA
jgi:hypothetical protein